MSERQWGTVREDYSADGDAWNYFPHEHARSRAYRWGEDGIRLTATEYAAEAMLWPAIAKLLPNYPDLKVEIIIDYGLTNIVTERIDAGVRPGGIVAREMVAVRSDPI